MIDPAGAPVTNAVVTLIPPKGGKITTVTSDIGAFEIPSLFAGTIVIEATGFARYEKRFDSISGDSITLLPSPVSAIVNVTGSETRIDETASSVIALNQQALETTAAGTIDDKLRQVPGFSLFRRAGSRTANPTTQGVSLRGVGPSGTSRALVIVDGIPLNDPFGGWIYWGRVPGESIAQIEVLRGAAGDLYGSSAVGGVVSIISKSAATQPMIAFEAAYGNQETPSFSMFATGGHGNFAGSLAAEVFRTRGYVTVAEADRGPIDTAAGVARWTLNPYAEWKHGSNLRLFAAANFYSEVRRNGTPQQNNDTRLRRFAAGANMSHSDFGDLALRIYGGPQLYHQSFTTVNTGRSAENLSRLQTSPSRVAGGSVRWNASAGTAVLVSSGLELRRVSGRSDETVYSAGRAITQVSAGGKELSFGAYAGLSVLLSPSLTFSGGLRYDRWNERSGYSSTATLSTGQTSTRNFSDRSESAVSPRASLLYKAREGFSLYGSYSTGFRQPTLNELYRPFRVGDVLTLANENLTAERARNLEAGFIFSGFGQRLYARGDVFCTSVTRPVANLTLSVTPSLITRQRQNLGRTSTCGFEADGQLRISAGLTFSAGYLYANSIIDDFPPDPASVGLRLPQVPRHQFSAQANYSHPELFDLGVQFRSVTDQFDDDQNRFRLGGFATVDVLVSRKLGHGVLIFAAVENAANARIESGRTPLLTLGQPRTARFGVRFRLR